MAAKLTVLYGHPDDPEAFENYYANTHMSLVDKIPLQSYEVSKIVATPDGSDLPYYRIFEGYSEDMEQLQNSLATQEGQAAVGDIPNFATGGATIFISEIDA
jgi:uncharacterized protein (TIGR02118 family)